MIDSPDVWVLKIGGDELRPGPALARVALLAAQASRRGRSLVVVHGGGDEVTERAAALGLATEKRDGQRVTDEATLEVVVEVLAGRVNARLTNALEGAGVPAVGLTGVSGGLLRVRPAGVPPGSLGWVGDPTAVTTRLLRKLHAEGFVPVLASLGADADHRIHNVNADLAAAAVAGAMRAALFLVTDVPGVKDASGAVRPSVSPAEARRLIATGVATDGMAPKLEAALRATAHGAPVAWIGPLEALSDAGPRPGAGSFVAGGPRAVPTLPILPRRPAPGGP